VIFTIKPLDSQSAPLSDVWDRQFVEVIAMQWRDACVMQRENSADVQHSSNARIAKPKID
jgi:hypothetical protein